MEEKRTAGGKEFFISIVWSVFLFTLSQYIGAAMETYHIVANLTGIAMFCILGFFVLTRYCASYTYSVKDGRVHIQRLIGHRSKEVDFAVSNIKSISSGNSSVKAKNVCNMTTKMLLKKGTYCIVFNKKGFDEAVIFEPSKEMVKYIKQQIKEG